MRVTTKDYIFVVAVLVALLGGFILGVKPWEVTKTPGEHLSELYNKAEADGIKLYLVQKLDNRCAIGFFHVESVSRLMTVCQKREATIDENLPLPFSGRLFDYNFDSDSFEVDQSTQEGRMFITEIVGRIINYVES